MKCPVCVEKNMKSTISVGMSTSTLLYCPPYYDEDGKYHVHDSNAHSTNYTCSHGHAWISSDKSQCPSCDFGKDSERVIIIQSEEIVRNDSFGGDISVNGGYVTTEGSNIVEGDNTTISSNVDDTSLDAKLKEAAELINMIESKSKELINDFEALSEEDQKKIKETKYFNDLFDSAEKLKNEIEELEKSNNK